MCLKLALSSVSLFVFVGTSSSLRICQLPFLGDGQTHLSVWLIGYLFLSHGFLVTPRAFLIRPSLYLRWSFLDRPEEDSTWVSFQWSLVLVHENYLPFVLNNVRNSHQKSAFSSHLQSCWKKTYQAFSQPFSHLHSLGLEVVFTGYQKRYETLPQVLFLKN